MKINSKEMYCWFVLIIIYCFFIISASKAAITSPSFEDQNKNLATDQYSRVESNPEKFLTIDTVLIPEKNFYSLNDNIRVCIEIKDARFGRMEATLDNPEIYEIVGDLCKVTTRSKYIYKITDIKSLAQYYSNLSKRDPDEPYPIDSRFHFEFNGNIGYNKTIGKMRGHERYLYWYNITPKNYGLLELKTIVRTAMYSDIENRKIIEIKKAEPRLNIYPVINKTKTIQNERVGIRYYITCLNEQEHQKNWTVLIKLEKPNNRYFEYADSNQNLTFFKNIQKFQTIMIPIEVIYPNEGKYYPPLISINDVPYSFSDQIIVEPFFKSHNDFLNSILILLSVISTILIIYIDSRKGIITWRMLIKNFMRKNFLTTILLSLSIIALGALIIIGFVDSELNFELILMEHWKSIIYGFGLMLLSFGILFLYFMSNLGQVRYKVITFDARFFIILLLFISSVLTLGTLLKMD